MVNEDTKEMPVKHSKELKQPKLKILPNKVFRALWEAAQKMEYDEYVKRFTHPGSPDNMDFPGKLGMSYNQTYSVLKNIYDLANLSFKEILSLTEKRKAQISDIYVIPIRTVEEWYSGKNRCPDHIRITILTNYYKLDLGKRVITEAEKERRENRPSIYAPRKIQEAYIKRRSEDDDFERRLKEIDKITSKYGSPVSSGMSTQELLAKTDYLTHLRGYPHRKSEVQLPIGTESRWDCK